MASLNPNATLNVVYVVMSNVAMNSWICIIFMRFGISPIEFDNFFTAIVLEL